MKRKQIKIHRSASFHTMELTKIMFAAINLTSSLHMLTIPKLWQQRLTCWTQHIVTILSMLMLLPSSFIREIHFDHTLNFLQGTVTCLSTGVAFLFTGLLLIFGLLGRSKTATPLSKLPLTTNRILRNLWSHYGIALALWRFQAVQVEEEGGGGGGPTLVHQAAANMGYLLWAVWYGRRAKEIYDVPISIELISSGALPVMVTCLFLFNVFMYEWMID